MALSEPCLECEEFSSESSSFWYRKICSSSFWWRHMLKHQAIQLYHVSLWHLFKSHFAFFYYNSLFIALPRRTLGKNCNLLYLWEMLRNVDVWLCRACPGCLESRWMKWVGAHPLLSLAYIRKGWRHSINKLYPSSCLSLAVHLQPTGGRKEVKFN